MAVTAQITNQIISYTVKVTYETFDILLDPCGYLESNLLISILSEVGLAQDLDLVTCNVDSVGIIQGRNIYKFTITVS